MAKQNIFGLLYDPKTGKVTYEDGEIPAIGGDFTFENHPGYNPLQYATDKTGTLIVAILDGALPAGIDFDLFRTEVEGPIQPPPQLQVRISNQGIFGDFNVGLIANSIIRQQSLVSVKAELKAAGILL